jgi:hypothetical protein
MNLIPIKTAIENLYKVFKPYTTMGMVHCDCGCIDEDNVKKLYSKPLQELEEDDLGYYHYSAIHTWGEIEHYKHFIPRILELMHKNRSYSFIHLDEFFSKINEEGDWRNWNSNELEAINDYFFSDWNEYVNNEKTDVDDSDIENYMQFFDLKTLLTYWNLYDSKNGLRNIIHFLYLHGNTIINGGIKLNNKKYQNEFKIVFANQKFIDLLETSFFNFETKYPEYSMRISVVLQMIEQEKL